jgi:acetyl-CoA carboxylase biotin carboxyl carrier protein
MDEAERTDDVDPGDGPGGIAELDAVHDSVLAIVARARRPPAAVRVAVGDVSVEARWADRDGGTASGDVPAGPAAGDGPSARDTPPADGRVHVVSPTAGTFYRAPTPGDPPFVEVGDHVGAGQQVAVVESMKIFFAVHAEVAGVVVAVLAGDGSLVDHGHPLLAVQPG